MNERIKEIARNAGFELNPAHFDHEKFTELIIKECANTIENWKKEPFPFDEDLAVKLIYEHFGLELPPKNIRVIKI